MADELKKPKPRFEVRTMRIEDIASVFTLGERVFTVEQSPTLYRTWDEYQVVDLFSTDGDTCFVAECDDRIIGFTLGTMINKRRNSWIYGYLIWLAVDPEFVGLGIGRELVEYLVEEFIEQGARMVLVDTDADKDDALRFFKRMGFGHPQEHVFLSMNLTSRPDYRRIRARAEKRK